MDMMTNNIFGRHVMLRKCTRSQHHARASCLSLLFSKGLLMEGNCFCCTCTVTLNRCYLRSSSLQQASAHVTYMMSIPVRDAWLTCFVLSVPEKLTCSLKQRLRNTQTRTIEDSKRYSCHYRSLPLGIAVKQVFISKIALWLTLR